MNRWLLGALGAALLIGILLLFRLPAKPEPAHEDAVAGGEPASGHPPPAEVAKPAPAAEQPSVRTASPPPAAAPPPAPAESQATTDPATPPTMPGPPQRDGRVDELKALYQNDSADSTANAMEARLRTLFSRESMPADALQSVTCHRRVCRLRLEWSEDQPLSFMAAYMGVGVNVNKHVGVEPLADEPDDKGVMPFYLYVLRDDLSEEELGDITEELERLP